MGNSLRGWNTYWDPEGNPKTHMPSVFDPMYGFPNGRKKREMKVTEEEMVHWGLRPVERDYCAHILVDYYKCRMKYDPLLINTYCGDLRHHWETCQGDDQLLRMKEYERERRLLARERRLKEKAAAEEAAAQAESVEKKG